MFTQEITPVKKPVIIDLPDEYLGHKLIVTVSETREEEANKYSFENALKFWADHRIDLSHFTFNRDEANER